MFNSTNLVGFNLRANPRRKSWCHSKGNLFSSTPAFRAKYVGDYIYLMYQMDNGTYYAINILKIDRRTNTVIWSRKITKSYDLIGWGLDVSASGTRVFAAIQSGANLTSILELSASTGADVNTKDFAYIARAISFNNAENRLYLGGTSNNQFSWLGSINTSTWSSAWSKTTSYDYDVVAICADEANGGAWNNIAGHYGVFKTDAAGAQVTAFGVQNAFGGGLDLALIGNKVHHLNNTGHGEVDVSGTPTLSWGKYWDLGSIPYEQLVPLPSGEVLLVGNYEAAGQQAIYHFKKDGTPTNQGAILLRQGTGKFSQDLRCVVGPEGRLLMVGQADSFNALDDYAVLCVEHNLNVEWSGDSPDPTFIRSTAGATDTMMYNPATSITYPYTAVTFGTAAAMTLSTVTTTNSADTVAVEKFAFF